MEDRSIVVAVSLEKSAHCQSCGTAEYEWLQDDDAYRAVQTVCLGCAAKDRARADSDTDKTIPGASIKLVPAAVAERMTSAPAARPLSRRERARGRR